MEGSSVNSLEDVFKKWEKKGEERRQNQSFKSSTNSNYGDVIQSGRAAWAQKFDGTMPPRRRPTRRKKQNYDVDPISSTTIERTFRLMPPVLKNHYRSSRPFLSTGCPRCFQKSKAMFLTKKATCSPLRNLLDLSMFCRKSLFRRVFTNILYVGNLTCTTNQNKLSDVKHSVLKSPRVTSTIQKFESSDLRTASGSPEKETVTSKELRLKGKNIITTMSSMIRGYLIRLSTWFLFKFFGKVMSSIQVHQGQIAVLQKASEKNIPIVYLPLHKSHVDYVLISFVLSCYNLKVPYIVAGDNLNGIPIFSWLMRNMGGFFIKRSIGDLKKPENELYNVILDEYMTQILESGNSLEVYIEGTRSRTGKCYPPKVGVLSTIVSTVLEGRVSDVLIVPVNISYEKILETGYSDELMGKPKETESFLQITKGIWRIIWSHYGHVSMNFGLPFSLKEFLEVSENSEACQNYMKNTARRSSPRPALASPGIRKTLSEISLETLDPSNVALTKSVACHVMYDCVHCSTIMAPNMVAFLLLTKFCKGVILKELESALELLKKDILIRKRDFGFSGCNAAVISHSLKILGEDIVSFDSTSSYIQPNLSLPSVLKLSYYSNAVLSVYVLESVIACSVGALLASKDVSLTELIDRDITISRRELLDTALDLCDLLCREFVFAPPCMSLETSLVEAIDNFIAADVLNVCENQGAKSRERQWANRLAVSTGWFDDDSDEEIEIADQEYKVNSSEEAVKKITFFRLILSPIIESYWFVACGLPRLQLQEFTEKDFIQELHACAVRRVEIGTAFYNESCSLAYLTNAVKVFQISNIVKLVGQEGTPCSLLKLNDGFQDHIQELITQINNYKM